MLAREMLAREILAREIVAWGIRARIALARSDRQWQHSC
jgi:hypothetical protein